MAETTRQCGAPALTDVPGESPLWAHQSVRPEHWVCVRCGDYGHESDPHTHFSCPADSSRARPPHQRRWVTADTIADYDSGALCAAV